MKLYSTINEYIQKENKSYLKYKVIDSNITLFEGTKDECLKYIDSKVNKDTKKVIIVGPSPHLINLNLGEKIDSYDVVVRMNNSYTISNHKDFGSRTDYLFLNQMWVRNNKSLIPDLKRKFKENLIIKQENLNSKAPKGYNLNTNWSSNMGVLTILHLINEGYKNISLTGFSFYQNHPFYVDEHFHNQKGMVLKGESHPQKKTIKEINEFIKLNHIHLMDDTKYWFDLTKEKYL